MDNSAEGKVFGKPIGFAQGIAVRFIFMSDWLGDSGRASAQNIEDEIEKVLNKIEGYSNLPTHSFYDDITTNEGGTHRLPYVLPCAAPTDIAFTEDQPNYPELNQQLRVIIPEEIRSQWEGETVRVKMTTGDHLALHCSFADNIALFRTGHIAYCLTLNLHKGSADWPAKNDVPLYPNLVLALTDLARSAKLPPALRSTGPIRFALEAEHPNKDTTPRNIISFVHERLLSLANASYHKHPDHPDYFDVYKDIYQPLYQRLNLTLSPLVKHRPPFGLKDLRSVSCEIVEFKPINENALSEALKQADTYRVEGAFAEAIAGLAQNVIDYEDQDAQEISDSLVDAENVGNGVYFVSASSIVVFSEMYRSFERLRHYIGGSLYVLLPILSAIYNEMMVDDAATRLNNLRPEDLSNQPAITSTEQEIDRRYGIFRHNLRQIIPNLFRYPSHAKLFDYVMKRRSVDKKAEQVKEELRQYEGLAHDYESINFHRWNQQTNTTALVLAVWGFFAVVLTVVSLFAAFHSDAQEMSSSVPSWERSSAETFIVIFTILSIGAFILAVVISLREVIFPLARRMAVERLGHHSRLYDIFVGIIVVASVLWASWLFVG